MSIAGRWTGFAATFLGLLVTFGSASTGAVVLGVIATGAGAVLEDEPPSDFFGLLGLCVLLPPFEPVNP